MSHALSYGAQPFLRDLVQEVTDSDSKITLFCGAGVTIDSGLPNWSDLVRNLAHRVPDTQLQSVILGDTSNLERKTEYILSLVKGARSADDVISEALYQGGAERLAPGILAQELAQLVHLLLGRVRILTTNYDDRVEAALRDLNPALEPVSLGLNDQDIATWENAIDSPVPHVMHVHGYLPSDAGDRIGPAVLSESFYLRYGTRVQEVIESTLRESTTIFLGVSLTDPNVIGPLHAVRDKEISAYLVMVPEAVSGADADTPGRLSHGFAVTQANYFAREFRVRPIILKSYSQISQLVRELRVATSVREQYAINDEDSSMRYGYRLRRITRASNELVGVIHGSLAPGGANALSLSDALDAELTSGPLRRIREFTSAFTWEEFERYGIDPTTVNNELFGLFLWLRSARPDLDHSPAPYQLFLAGTSVYAHRRGSTVRRKAYVHGDSPYAAVKAMYSGTALIETSDAPQPDDAWQSYWATTFDLSERDVSGSGDDLYPITAGAVALHSSHRIESPDVLNHSWTHGADVPRLYRPSVMSLMSVDDRVQLTDLIAGAARKAVQTLALTHRNAQ